MKELNSMSPNFNFFRLFYTSSIDGKEKNFSLLPPSVPYGEEATPLRETLPSPLLGSYEGEGSKAVCKAEERSPLLTPGLSESQYEKILSSLSFKGGDSKRPPQKGNKEVLNIIVDGNIGASKTTILSYIKLKTKLSTKEEPLDSFKKILIPFYEDQERWAFPLNMKILSLFLKGLCSDKTTVYERSCYSCFFVFVQNAFVGGRMTEAEYEIFYEFFLLPGLVWSPDIIIYIKTTPETCLKRIQGRGREGEEKIPLEYLQKLDSYYEKMITMIEKFRKDITIYRVDGEKTQEEINLEIDKVFKELQLF